MATTKAHQWWWLLILSILILILGFVVLFNPLTSFVALSIFFTWTILFSGFFNLFFALRNVKTMDSWIWFLLLGILEIVISIALFLQPHISQLALILYVAFWLTFKGVMSLSYSFELKKFGFKDWWVILLGGIATLILAFLMLIRPIFSVIAVVYLAGFSLLTAGTFGIWLSLQLKNLEGKLAG
jgi:uncharacterized membrane protein HdeD (DUF308 family)